MSLCQEFSKNVEKWLCSHNFDKKNIFTTLNTAFWIKLQNFNVKTCENIIFIRKRFVFGTS